MSDRFNHDVNQDLLLKASGFWKRNQKAITSVVVVVVLAVAGYMAWQSWVVAPKELKASDAIAPAQRYFAADSFRLALDGDGANKGFIYVQRNFSGTKTANLAGYYAGFCYLHLGDFQNAVKYLKDFSTGAKQIQMMAYGGLADAYSELGKKSDAVDYYKKAAAEFTSDEGNSSEYLFRAAMLSETEGKQKEALDLYKELKEKFPNTEKGFQADKYIYRLSIEKNDLPGQQ